MPIADNLRRVQERIAAAAHAAGRSPEEITLVGVTKYVGAPQARELVAAGCTNLGESRPQELWNKFGEVASATGLPAVRWHLIGHLQRNKIRRTLPLVSLIHSVDSERLLSTINDARAADAANSQPVSVLLEVNTSNESAKHGLALAAVEPLLATAPSYPHVAIRGLMTMAALEGGETIAARNFGTLRELRDKLKQVTPAGIELNELSMGMSNDFEIAIKEGATIVRVGSALWK
jgi:pyridoxal phosphate enzyme (YggS family)